MENAHGHCPIATVRITGPQNNASAHELPPVPEPMSIMSCLFASVCAIIGVTLRTLCSVRSEGQCTGVHECQRSVRGQKAATKSDQRQQAVLARRPKFVLRDWTERSADDVLSCTTTRHSARQLCDHLARLRGDRPTNDNNDIRTHPTSWKTQQGQI